MLGQLGGSEEILAFVGGNCSILGFDHLGEEHFWTVREERRRGRSRIQWREGEGRKGEREEGREREEWRGGQRTKEGMEEEGEREIDVGHVTRAGGLVLASLPSAGDGRQCLFPCSL